MCLFEDVNIIGYFLLCRAFIMGGINIIEYGELKRYMYVTHDNYMNTTLL